MIANIIRIIVVLLFSVAGGVAFSGPGAQWPGVFLGFIVGTSIVLIEIFA